MEKVIKIIAFFLDIQNEDIKPDAELRSMADSLDFIELIMLLEDEYQIDIPDEDIDSIITVKDLCDYLYKFDNKQNA